jgi:23S rRNA pseudouridine955/2504/2580 synthase
METLVTPLDHGTHKGRPYTLAQVRIFTGRTHQIRSQLAHAGYPLLGDTKYGGSAALNPTQLLHSWKLYFREMPEGKLSYLSGRTVECDPPENFKAIEKKIFRKE